MTRTGQQAGPDLEFGVDSLCWNWQIANEGMTLLDVLDQARTAGALWLRLHRNHLTQDSHQKELEAIRARAAEHGQRIIWSGDGLGKAADGVKSGVEHVRAELANAVRIGAPIIQFYASWFRFDADIVQGGVANEINYLTEVLREVAPAVVDEGLTLALENHSNVTSAEMVALLDAVGAPHIRAYLDVANTFTVHEEIVPGVATLAPYTVAIDVKDIVLRSNWASRQWHRHGFTVDYVWPGAGILPWPGIWSALGSNLARDTVPLIVEGLDESRTPVQAARDAAAFMASLPGPRLVTYQD